MSKGSVLGPDVYLGFTQSLVDLIRHYDIVPTVYAGSQTYIYFNPSSNMDVKEAVSKMELCFVKFRNWMSNNQLKLNKGKTEFMIS